MFTVLGFTAGQEAIYLALLDKPSSSEAELRGETGLRQAEVHKGLAALEQRGFITEVPTTPSRYQPVPPDLAVGKGILDIQAEIEEARIEAFQLAERFRATSERAQPSRLIEIVTGADAVDQVWHELAGSARDEVLVVDRPPYVNPGEVETELEPESLAHGVRWRTIYSAEALEIPEKFDGIRRVIEAGEEARTLHSVTTKLAIVDLKIALVPLEFAKPVIKDAALVHASFLLEALSLLFELLWERASPLSHVGRSDRPKEEGLDPETEAVLRLLMAGLKDDTIARTLRVSRSTVLRRIRDLLRTLDAQTRFQAGAMATRLGLIRFDD